MSSDFNGHLEGSVRRWKQYPAYKGSGVAWLQQLPAAWKEVRLKFLSTFCGGGTPSKANVEFWKGEIPWASPKDMKAEVIEDTEDHISEAAVAASSTRLIPPGVVLVVVRSGILRHSIPVAVTAREMALNQDMRAIMPKAGLRAEYLAAVIRGHQAELLSQWRKQGATVESIEVEYLTNTSFPVPPLDEQDRIIGFLRGQTAEIDVLIAKKKRLIELLQEKRTAIISRAVTKGLDPGVPMTDSGVAWMGQIPAGWDVSTLGRYVCGIEQGWSPVADDRLADDEEWGVIKLGAVSKGRFRSSEHKAVPKDLRAESRYEVRDGDFLVTRANTPELVGDVCVVQNPRPRLMLCDLVYRVRLNEDRINKRFLAFCLLSRAGRYQITREARGSSQSMVKIAQRHVRAFLVVLPPSAEQADIVAFLDRETARVDALIVKVQQGIDKLREYRTALISAAVTGKIDVREEGRR